MESASSSRRYTGRGAITRSDAALRPGQGGSSTWQQMTPAQAAKAAKQARKK